MKTKIKITLDTNDIRTILAEKYGVQAKQVELSAHQTCVGYGFNETYIYEPFATISKEEEM